MKVGSGLCSGSQPLPELAANAVRQALAQAACERADFVLLFLTRDFSNLTQASIRAAAGAAGCLQVSGCTVQGLFTEQSWQIDQSAAAALVIAELGDTRRTESAASSPLLSFSAQGRLNHDWQTDKPRVGLVDSDGGSAWQQARPQAEARSQCPWPLPPPDILISPGLTALGETFTVDDASGHELRQINGKPASEHLRRALPSTLRESLPLHPLYLLRSTGRPAIALLSINGDASITLAEAPVPGEQLCWAIRQPLAAEHEMRKCCADAVDRGKKPEFALMFSCIGRGPFFYGGEDRDWLAFRAAFPDVPLLGAYGIGQIIPGTKTNHLYLNTVLTLLYESPHVQSQP